VAQNLYSERQIAMIRESGKIVSQCLEAVKRLAVPGSTTRKMDQAVGEIIAKRGAKSPFMGYAFPGKKPFPANLCASINDCVVHGVPDDTLLVEGDLVSIDVGVTLNGYIGDSAWTFAIGEPDPAAKRLLAAGEEALWAGIEAAKPRGKINDIARAVQALVEGRGYSVVREFVGHGVGQSLHEEPQVPNYVDENATVLAINKPLKPGMVIAIEPMVNEGLADVKSDEGIWPVLTKDGSRSVHFEHTIAILNDRIEILTLP